MSDTLLSRDVENSGMFAVAYNEGDTTFQQTLLGIPDDRIGIRTLPGCKYRYVKDFSQSLDVSLPLIRKTNRNLHSFRWIVNKKYVNFGIFENFFP
jgi:hypothetical protein